MGKIGNVQKGLIRRQTHAFFTFLEEFDSAYMHLIITLIIVLKSPFPGMPSNAQRSFN